MHFAFQYIRSHLTLQLYFTIYWDMTHTCLLENWGRNPKIQEGLPRTKRTTLPFRLMLVVDKYVDKEGNEKDEMIELRFIDSFKFMARSLNSLTNNLVKGGEKLMGFEDYSEEQYELLVRKGINPYEYMSSWDKFAERQFPSKKGFYSNLNMSNISDDDYQQAQKIWNAFNIKNLGEYHNLYLKTDIILLANVFELFRDTFLEHYKLQFWTKMVEKFLLTQDNL